jgi:GNAT superfamily N-acetyltransferase
MNVLPVEKFSADDMPQLITVTESAGWRHTADDWQAALDVGTVSGHRSDRGEIMSTIAVYSYGGVFTSVGMVIVKPEFRGHGLAKALMLHALASPAATTYPTILIATPYGLPLYQRLGFKTIDQVCSMTRIEPPRRTAVIRASVVPAPLAAHDAAEVRRLDAEATGLDRARVIDARLRYADRASVLRGGDRSVVGFGIATPMRDALMIGPVIAPDTDCAMALIADLASEHDGRVRVDVPVGQTAFRDALTAAGFSPGDEAPLMIYNGEALPGNRMRVFAIATRAFC